MFEETSFREQRQILFVHLCYVEDFNQTAVILTLQIACFLCIGWLVYYALCWIWHTLLF